MGLSVLAVYDGLESGCNYYRLLVPYTALREYGWNFDWMPIGDKSKEIAKDDWVQTPAGWLAPPDMAKKSYNVLNLIRPMVKVIENGPGLPHSAIVKDVIDQAHRGGSIVTGDLDDDMWSIPDSNPWKAKAGADTPDVMRETVRNLDFMTCSTEYLKHRIVAETGIEERRVVVVPNLIDFDLWDATNATFQLPDGTIVQGSFREARRNRLAGNVPGPVVIGLQGGDSHREDWKMIAPVLKRITGKYGEAVRVVVAGYHPDYLREALQGATEKGLVLWQPFVTFSEHPDTVLQFDINLCPLLDTEFNRSKSAIKWMEAAAVGGVSVASPTVYGDYIVPGATGLIARDEDEWVSALSFLIEKREVRQDIGRKAHATVRTHFNLQTRAFEWVEAYSRMLFESRDMLRFANATWQEEKEIAAMAAA